MLSNPLSSKKEEKPAPVEESSKDEKHDKKSVVTMKRGDYMIHI
jgi:hypothetical protein